NARDRQHISLPWIETTDKKERDHSAYCGEQNHDFKSDRNKSRERIERFPTNIDGPVDRGRPELEPDFQSCAQHTQCKHDPWQARGCKAHRLLDTVNRVRSVDIDDVEAASARQADGLQCVLLVFKNADEESPTHALPPRGICRVSIRTSEPPSPPPPRSPAQS